MKQATNIDRLILISIFILFLFTLTTFAGVQFKRELGKEIDKIVEQNNTNYNLGLFVGREFTTKSYEREILTNLKQGHCTYSPTGTYYVEIYAK